jgi:hypothetical protein
MTKKSRKIVNGDYSLAPKNGEKFPQQFLYDSDRFVDRWATMVRESYQAEGQDVTKPTPGIVLAVKKNGKVSPGGPRERTNSISSDETETCLKLWVHTEYDSALSVPKNFLNPGDEEKLIYQHFVFEAQNEEIDKVVPKPGDIVSVIHPWAFGFTNKVGIYVGKISEGTAPTLKKTSSNFDKKNNRSKTVP